MTRLSTTIALASAALFSVAAEARSDTMGPELRETQKLIVQGHTQLQAMHRRHPHCYGGHDVRAARLLRMASRELDEAELYRKYNPAKKLTTGAVAWASTR